VFVLTALLVPSLLTSPTTIAAADKWPDPDAGELKLATSVVEPNADAEVLLWDVRVSDEIGSNDEVGTFLDHYLRIKVFTDRGRDTESRVDIPYRSGERIKNIDGRSIAPDGKITELRASEIFDRTIVAIGGVKLKAKSFVLPAVVPGSIVEYRWREVHEDAIAHYIELPFQREIPIQTVRYHIKPLDVGGLGLRMRTQLFNMTKRAETSNEAKGFTQIQVRGAPSLKKEPYMPAELAAKAWILLFYESTKMAELPTSQFWGTFAGDFYQDYQPRIKPSGDIKKMAKMAVPAGATPDQTIDALVQYVRDHVKAPPENAPFKPNKNAGDALSRGVGTDDDLTMAFVALASAAGLDARLVAAGDRSTVVLEPDMKQPYTYSSVVAAVKMGENVRYVDASNRYSRGGHLRWQQEGVPVIVMGEKDFAFSTTPAMPPTFSSRRHTGTLKLLENGTLEGDISIQLTGHLAAEEREDAADRSADERKQAFEKAIVERIPGATVSQFAIENLENLEQPYTVKFRVSVPRYSERTGSRLFLQPAVMQHGLDALFASVSRQYKVVFPYNWTEEDAITVDLPSGYTLEPGAPPAPAAMAMGRYDVQPSADGRQVKFSRLLAVGSPGRNSFTPAEYPPIKAFFDTVKRGDGYTLALRGAGA
jgi:hypothetical protein